jgi:type II secretory pathway pseudopilin PulG
MKHMLFNYMSSRDRAALRGGFTLIELMIGTLITSIVLVVSFQLLVGERRSSEARRQEMSAQQNLRVVVEQLNQDIRMSGFGIDEFNNQPGIVDAGPFQIIFNADISSGVGGDPAMDVGLQIKLSDGTAYSPGNFPGENIGTLPHYNGGAETVVLGLDSNYDGQIDSDDMYDLSQNPLDYALYRSINGIRSERVAYGMRGPDAYPDGFLPQPIFKYWGNFAGGSVISLWGDTNDDGDLDQGELAGLTPLAVGSLDNILYVDLDIVAFTGSEVTRTGHLHGTAQNPFNYFEVGATTRIRPRNVGVNPANLSACGAPPARPTGVWAQDTPADAGSSISIYFTASTDENGGEEDVTHYFIYRKEQGGVWGGALAQVPAAGLATYSYANDLHTPDDANIPIDGINYYYAVTAWDCKPQESNPSAQAGPVSCSPNGSQPPVLVSVFDTPCDSGEDITVLFDQSPDEGGGLVSGYRIYRGPVGGDFLSKTLIGFVATTGSPSYTYHDNLANNIAGAPPVDGTDYWFTVRAVNDTIVSVDSNELGPVACHNGLSAAQLVSVNDVPFDDGTRLQISWLRSESETCFPNIVTGYELQCKGPMDDDFLDVGFYVISGDPAYMVEDSGLIPGQPYTYRVVTKSASEALPGNELVGIPTNNNDLLPPTNVVAAPVQCDASGSIVISWDRSYHDNGSGDVEFYRIWRRVQGAGAWGELDRVVALGFESYEFNDDGTSPSPPVIGSSYEYVITAFNETHGNESGYSQMAGCTSSSVPGSPYLYYAIDTPNDTGNSITLKFRKSADDGDCTDSVTEYHVYRSQTWGAYPAQPHFNVSANGSYDYTVYDNGSQGDAPENEHEYYYMIRAYDEDIESADSNQRGPAIPLDDVVVATLVFSDGFESDIGWTHGGSQDDWQRGNPTAKNQTYGEADPDDAHLGSRVYGTDIGGSGWNGSYRANADSWLVSPQIDCDEVVNVRFGFWRWLNVEQPIYDRAIVEVSGDGPSGPWHQIWTNSVEVTDTEWVHQEFDISQYADDASDLRIRFRLETDGSWHYSGWNIDDVEINGDH